jgi:hypothetical protein
LVVLYFAKPKIFEFDFTKSLLGEKSLLVIILAVFGVIIFLSALFVRKKLIQVAIEQQNFILIQMSIIIGGALCEAISLFGLVLAFSQNYQYFFMWFALGILGMILHFPRRDNLIDASYKR